MMIMIQIKYLLFNMEAKNNKDTTQKYKTSKLMIWDQNIEICWQKQKNSKWI